MGQKIYVTLEEIENIIYLSDYQKAFLVTGKNSFAASGAKERLKNILNERTMRFYDFSPNPKLEDVLKGIELYNEFLPDIIISIGGGSVIDMAKLIKGLSSEQNIERAIKENRLEYRPNTELIAVATTSGSGSESTPFAAVYANGTKYSLQHPSLLPEKIVLDPSLTVSMSPRLTAITGMDALSQAIESYWSVNSNGESKEYARRAIPLILGNLKKAVNEPNPYNRKAMLYGANLAGKAIAIAKTTACHSISYPITSNFYIPHGHAVALTLAEVLKYNAELAVEDCIDSRGLKYVKQTMREIIDVLGTNSVEGAKEKITFLMESINLETTLGKLGLDSDAVVNVVKQGFNPQRMKNNPRLMNEENLREIIQKIK